jgi:hypothetical protein
MPVNASVHQPMGLRQTSVALAESVGSAASQFFINAKNKYVELKYRQII